MNSTNVMTIDEKKPSEAKKKKKLFDFSNFFGKLKKIKNIEIYLTVALGLIIVLIFLSSNPFNFFSSSDSKDKNSSETITNAYDYCVKTESRLSGVLSTIKGAGKVEVMINFESSTEIIVAYITSTTTNGGESGNNSSTSSPQVLQQQGAQIPLILKTVNPKVLGVIVVAEGADNIKVKLDIQTAVCTLLDINPSLINVFTMKK